VLIAGHIGVRRGVAAGDVRVRLWLLGTVAQSDFQYRAHWIGNHCLVDRGTVMAEEGSREQLVCPTH